MKTKGRRQSMNVDDKTGALKRPRQSIAQAAHRSAIGKPSPSLSKPTGAFSKMLDGEDRKLKELVGRKRSNRMLRRGGTTLKKIK